MPAPPFGAGRFRYDKTIQLKTHSSPDSRHSPAKQILNPATSPDILDIPDMPNKPGSKCKQGANTGCAWCRGTGTVGGELCEACVNGSDGSSKWCTYHRSDCFID